MIAVVQTLQLVSGLLWLMPALYLAPRVIRSWQPIARRIDMLSAPICFFAWMMVGFSIHWLAWPGAVEVRPHAALVTWAALYALSSVLAVWVFHGARQTKGE